MTPYRGIIQITCKKKSGPSASSSGPRGCLRPDRIGKKTNNVQPGCMDCPEAVTRILDLDGKVIFEYRSPEIKTGKRKAPSEFT